ncbi:hypothetical protein [Azotosporobacter soli]|uniref:hypothetical protein n=1 Tax=Azotosporobacter soli TaxID=3055040 RepID=UPI0031FEEB3C
MGYNGYKRRRRYTAKARIKKGAIKVTVKLLGPLAKNENWKSVGKEIERQMEAGGLAEYTIAVRIATPEEEEKFELDRESVQCEYDAETKTMEYLLGIRMPRDLPPVYEDEVGEAAEAERICFAIDGIASGMLIEASAVVRANFIETLRELVEDERESQFI